jgi:inosose dehydratase
MNRVGETARRNGVKTSIHPHWGTVAESRLEIELLLSLLDADLVGNAPDTGQIAKGGADPMPIIVRCASMLRYLYMKDLSPEWVSMRRERIPLRSPEGQSETGQGIIDFRRLLPILAAFNYSGWLMAELDEAKRPPREAAALSKDDIAHTLGLALRQPVPSVRSIARAKARG